MLRVITANLNGIRSAAKKGFFEWFGQQNADVLCVQEIKCSQDDMTPEFMAPHDFTGYFQHAVKKGYSGAGVYTRHEPDEVVIGFGSEEFDPEGRYVELRFGKLSVVSVYVPSGSSGDERQQAKYQVQLRVSHRCPSTASKFWADRRAQVRFWAIEDFERFGYH